MPKSKKTVKGIKSSLPVKAILFFLIGVGIIGLFIFFYTTGLITGSKAARRLPCVKKTDAAGKCIYECTTAKGVITVKCSSVGGAAAGDKEPKEDNGAQSQDDCDKHPHQPGCNEDNEYCPGGTNSNQECM